MSWGIPRHQILREVGVMDFAGAVGVTYRPVSERLVNIEKAGRHVRNPSMAFRPIVAIPLAPSDAGNNPVS